MIKLYELTQAIGELKEDRLMKLLSGFASSRPTEDEALAVVDACQRGMEQVGDLFESGEYFVGDLIFAEELLTQAIDILKPVIGGNDKTRIGKIVLGTVEGDLHDIGKNIFRSMAEAAGFQVYDLGIDQSPAEFVKIVKEVQPAIVGMSGVLSLSLDTMRYTVTALKEAGLCHDLKIIIGGNPVTNEACKLIGADAYTINAAEGVKLCKNWVAH